MTLEILSLKFINVISKLFSSWVPFLLAWKLSLPFPSLRRQCLISIWKLLNLQSKCRIVEPSPNWYICSRVPALKIHGLLWKKEWKCYWNNGKLAVRLGPLECQNCEVTGSFEIKTFPLWRKLIKTWDVCRG